jgi:hypothetical protein
VMDTLSAAASAQTVLSNFQCHDAHKRANAVLVNGYDSLQSGVC